MNKNAETSVAIDPLLASRWSPRAFDADFVISDEQLTSVLEAGRWAPSANNGQPWRFSVARRGSELFNNIVGATTGFNQAWLPGTAALIVVSVLHTNAEGNPYRTAQFDAGLAVQNLLLQATSLGLSGHVVGGMDREAMPAILSLPSELAVVVLVAIGKQGDLSQLEADRQERERAPRIRHALADIVLVND